MTEYETATLAFRTASLAAQHAGLWIAAAHVAVGLIQAAIVWYGIRAMQRAGDCRAEEQDQRHAEAMQRIDQQGAALTALIDEQREERAALIDGQRKQGAALAALIDEQREERAALIDGQREERAAFAALIDGQREQGAALAALVRRTAPPAAG